MPSQTFTPGIDTFDPTGKTNIIGYIRSAGGNGSAGEEETGGAGGGGGAYVTFAIPDEDLVGAASISVYVSEGGDSGGSGLMLIDGPNHETGIFLNSGSNSSGSGDVGTPGTLDHDTLDWATSAVFGGGNGGEGLETNGAGGGSSPGTAGNGNNGNANGTGGAAPTGGFAGGDGGEEGDGPGQAGQGLGAGGGGGGNGLEAAAGGTGGNGVVYLEWEEAESPDAGWPRASLDHPNFPYHGGWPDGGVWPPE